jgi:hypothetical protein
MGVSGLMICIGAIVLTAGASTKDRESARHLLEGVVNNLERKQDSGEMPARELTVEVKRTTVTITGRIQSANEAHLILDSILKVDGVGGIQLNLGVGRFPSPPCPCAVRPFIGADPDFWKRTPSWDDRPWQLDFTRQPQTLRHRTKRLESDQTNELTTR